MEVKTQRAPLMVSRKAKLATGANALVGLLLIGGILILLNILSTRFFVRIDLTEGNLNSLSPASIAAASELEGMTVRVFISPELPEKIDTSYNRAMQPRMVAERFRDVLEEYAASSGGSVRLEYVTDDVLEEARRAKLPTFSSQEAELMGGGMLKFKEYVIGATFIYKTAMERFPREVVELQPETFEFELTKRMVKLRDRIAHADAYKDVLDAGKGIVEAVRACADAIKGADAPEEGAGGGGLAGILGSQQGRADNIKAYRESVPKMTEHCGKVQATIQRAAPLGRKNEFLELIIANASNFLRLQEQFAQGLAAGGEGDTENEFRLIQIHDALGNLATELESDRDRLEETPGQRKIAFLCGADAFCPFPDLEPKIKPELGMILGQKNAINQRVINQLQQIEQQINGLNQQIGTGLFRRRGYALMRANVGEAIPEQASALIIYAPRKPLDDKAWYHIDQFILSGKPTVVVAGQWDVSILNARPPEGDAFGGRPSFDLIRLGTVESNLGERLSAYGVGIDQKMVIEPKQHDQITLTVLQTVGGQFSLPVKKAFPYPLLPRVTDLNAESVLVRGVEGITLPYAAPLTIDEGATATITPLARSSADSAAASQNIPLEPGPVMEFADQATADGPHVVAAMVEGQVSSAFGPDNLPKLADDENDDRAAKLAFRSDGTARLIVIGSSLGLEGLTVDRVLGEVDMAALTQNPVSLITKFPEFQANLQNWEVRIGQLAPIVQENLRFIFNLMDWASQQEELVEIRAKGVQRRPLISTEPGTRKALSWGLIAGLPAFVTLFGLLGMAMRQRRKRTLSL